MACLGFDIIPLLSDAHVQKSLVPAVHTSEIRPMSTPQAALGWDIGKHKPLDNLSAAEFEAEWLASVIACRRR